MLIFLTIVGAALLGLIVVVIYLNDRVNELERRTASTAGGGGGGGGDLPSGPSWQGLTGKKLWDAMCGKKGATNLDPAVIDGMRPAYEAVLTQHIQSLFQAGQNDARRGQSVQPTATRTLSSPLGSVQSWIPLNHANAIYRAGVDSAKDDIFEVERARMSLDETASVLFSQTQIPQMQLFSERIMGGGASVGESGGGVDGAGPAGGTAVPDSAGASGATASASAPAALAAPGPGGMFSASAPPAPAAAASGMATGGSAAASTASRLS